jgi:hypothetical protein
LKAWMLRWVVNELQRRLTIFSEGWVSLGYVADVQARNWRKVIYPHMELLHLDDWDWASRHGRKRVQWNFWI